MRKFKKQKLALSMSIVFLLFVVSSTTNALIPAPVSGCGNGFQSGPSYTTNTCELSVNLGFVKIYSGGITTTTTCYNALSGEEYEETVTTGCGTNGGSWDWFWE